MPFPRAVMSSDDLLTSRDDTPSSSQDSLLAKFNSGATRVLVTTDGALAALADELCPVEHVISFDFPTNMTEYGQRLQHTGRCGCHMHMHMRIPMPQGCLILPRPLPRPPPHPTYRPSILPHPTASYLIPPLILPHPTSSYLILPHPTSSHLAVPEPAHRAPSHPDYGHPCSGAAARGARRRS